VCLIAGADLYKADAAGDVEMVTGHIDHVGATGITLRSDRHLEADAIIIATGITMSVDGEKVHPHERFIFRRHLLEDVPDAAWCLGQANGSWTPGTDMAGGESRSCWRTWVLAATPTLIRFSGGRFARDICVEARRRDMCCPRRMGSRGRVPAGRGRMHNFVRDAIDHRFRRIDESMQFGGVSKESVA
jgi:hypothetical protein